jgi:hypothetical protein
MSHHPLKLLLTKAKYLLYLESKLSAHECALHQWQLLATHGSVLYIVGKGGANTCFYKIGDDERQVCYPNDLIEFLTKLAAQKYSSYSIYTKDKKLVKKGINTLDKALAIGPVGSGMWIVGLSSTDNVKRRLYYSVSGLKSCDWVKYQKKA